jgi:hypothetical protein
MLLLQFNMVPADLSSPPHLQGVRRIRISIDPNRPPALRGLIPPFRTRVETAAPRSRPCLQAPSVTRIHLADPRMPQVLQTCRHLGQFLDHSLISLGSEGLSMSQTLRDTEQHRRYRSLRPAPRQQSRNMLPLLNRCRVLRRRFFIGSTSPCSRETSPALCRRECLKSGNNRLRTTSQPSHSINRQLWLQLLRRPCHLQPYQFRRQRQRNSQTVLRGRSRAPSAPGLESIKSELLGVILRSPTNGTWYRAYRRWLPC